VPEVDPIDALKALIASPNYCSRAWIYEQYDTPSWPTRSAPRRGRGHRARARHRQGAGLHLRRHPALRAANPVEGGKQAVAEAFRNLCAVGAKPLATTDNLNFGNPEKPEIMGQFVGAIKGHRRGLRALDMPIVSGNVSFTTRPTARRSCPRRPSARWVCSKTSTDDRRHDPRRAS
jgi:phosphoribosylformylglycinamidine (FGAM) synthase-like enzyme